MPALHLDCSFGLGGDMFLAALADAAPDAEAFLAGLERALRAAGLEVGLRCPRRRQNGLAGRILEIDLPAAPPLRRLPDLLAITAALPLEALVRERTARAFCRLAQAEARVHGIGLDDVHFHEVGAVDTVVDVAGAFYGLRYLGVTRVTAGALPWFTGFVDCAHGRLPLPAPAVLELLQGKPVFPTQHRLELVTPTGALLMDQVVDAFVPGPSGVILGTGTGWGSLDVGPGCTGLRAVLYEPRD